MQIETNYQNVHRNRKFPLLYELVKLTKNEILKEENAVQPLDKA
jgi:hypothetical protein